MTIVEYLDRFANCATRARGEPCHKCALTRDILAVLERHVPTWEMHIANMRSTDARKGAEGFSNLLAAAESAVVAAMFLCMFAVSPGDKDGNATAAEPSMWLEAFAGVLARELSRAGIPRRIAVVPRLDMTVLVDDPHATKH